MLVLLMRISVAAVLVLAIWTAARTRNWRRFALHAFAVALYAYLIRSVIFPSETATAKGPEDTKFLAVAVALYVCMILGMVAETLYAHLDQPGRRRKLQWAALLKPLLLSPMVFMPLVASLQSADVDLTRLDAARLMLFLVAFESGFLWKGYLARRAAELSNAKASAAASGAQ